MADPKTRSGKMLFAIAAMAVSTAGRADVFKFTGPTGIVTYTNMSKPGAVRVKATSYIWSYTPSYARVIPTGKRKAFAEMAEQVANKHGVDPDLVKAVIAVESGYDPNAISPKGAQGLMQLMPFTADRFEVKDVFRPEDNIEGGVKYLRFLLDLFDGNTIFAIAAYNAGENVVSQLRAIPPYAETEEYVKRVMYIKDNKEPDLGDKLYRRTLFTFTDDNGLTHLTDRVPSGMRSAELRTVRP